MAWNSSDGGAAASIRSPRNLTIKQSHNRTILLSLLIIAAFGGAALWWFLGRAGAPSPAAAKAETAKPGAITEAASPVSERQHRADTIKAVKAQLNDTVKGFIRKADTNNVIRLGPQPLDPDDPDNALRTQTMTEVQMLIGIEPGEPMPPVPFTFMMEDTVAEESARTGTAAETVDNGNKRFQEELAKWKITAKETDSDERIRRKNDLLGIQLELLDAIDKGVSVNDSIRAAWEFRKAAYEERSNLISALQKLNEADPDVAATKELIVKANEKLAEDGIKSIAVDEVLPDYEPEEGEQGETQP